MTAPRPALRAAAVTGEPGTTWCRRWTEQVDAALTDLLGAQGGVAIVAMGGYARRELCPVSDIDLVLLHDGWGRTDLESLVAQLCYPLWDAGLTVGHAVRTPAEAAAAASERIDTATAVLDRRLVAGDPGLVDAFAARVRTWSRRNARKAMVALEESTRSRHAEYGAVAGLQEPNLKEGAGGLRDIHALRWAAGWVLGEPSLDALVTAGYLSATDRAKLAGANAQLLAARCALHQLDTGMRGRAREVLRIQSHDEVAAALGYHDDAQRRGDGEAFLRKLLLAMRTASQLHDRTWPLLRADVGGRLRRRSQPTLQVSDGVRLRGRLIETDVADPSADVAWRAIAAAAEHSVPLGRGAAEAVQQVAAGASVSWGPAARESLLTTLRSSGAAGALREADATGLLGAAVPEWQRVRARPQRNALHLFDLDTHGAHAVGQLHRLRAEHDVAAAVWNRVEDRDALVLATWLHDVGKAWPGDHAEAGADVAGRWLGDMGFAPRTAQRASDLVRWHLLLPDVATRRDLDDPVQINAVAEIVGERDVVDALLLLSLADSRATGPAAWSAWKDSLLMRLHAEVRRALGSPMPAPAASTARPVVAAQARDGLRRLAPPRYFDIAGGDQVAAHASLFARFNGGVTVCAAVRDGAVPQTAVVSVVSANRDRLIADCAGVLAGFGVEVYEARVFTAEDVALCWFITPPLEDPRGVSAALEALGSEGSDVAALVRRRRWAGTRRHVPVPTDVTVRAHSVEVEATDSPALLYRLCTALADLGYGIAALRVSTLGPLAYDVFDLTRPVATTEHATLRDALTLAAQTPDARSP